MSGEGTLLRAAQLWEQIKPADLVRVLRHCFEVERLVQHFAVDVDHSFQSKVLTVNATNSIFLRFDTLKREYPDIYDSSFYNLLLILHLNTEQHFNDALRLELNNLARRADVDQTIIWTCRELDLSCIQTLKDSGVGILYIGQREIRKIKWISRFFPIEHPDYNYELAVNLAADLLMKRLKKHFHLVLSEIAAPIYDARYSTAKVATQELMRLEEDIVHEATEELKSEERTRLAVDVGCGTGRHAFLLAKKFNEVYAFDFSPNMINRAKSEKKRRGLNNVFFSIGDIEYEDIRDEHRLIVDGVGQADCVVASFGMGSFVEDTPRLLRRLYTWLADDGYLIISFYNADSILLHVTPNWRDTSLAAHLDLATSTLRVELAQDAVFHIFCKPYSLEIEAAIRGLFEIERNVTFPALMALMPNRLLQEALPKDLFLMLDRQLAAGGEYRLGYYVTVVARKRAGHADAHERILEILKSADASHRMLEHLPVLSVADVREEIGDHPGAMVKTVVFRDKKSRQIVVVALLAEKRLEKRELAKALGKSPNRIEFAPDRELIELGFPLGGVAPFGFPEDVEIDFLIDRAILESEVNELYMGAGDNRKTLVIKCADFKRIVDGYRSLEIPSAGAPDSRVPPASAE